MLQTIAGLFSGSGGLCHSVDGAATHFELQPHHLQDLAIDINPLCYSNPAPPWDEHPPRIASLLSAAARSCSKLQTLSLSGMSQENCNLIAHSAMSDDISGLSRLTALALHHDLLTSLSDNMSALTSLRKLSVSHLGSQLCHPLSALPNLHTLQVQRCWAC